MSSSPKFGYEAMDMRYSGPGTGPRNRAERDRNARSRPRISGSAGVLQPAHHEGSHLIPLDVCVRAERPIFPATGDSRRGEPTDLLRENVVGCNIREAGGVTGAGSGG